MLVSLGSNNLLFGGSLEKGDLKGVFEGIFGCEEFIDGVVDVIYIDCSNKFIEGVLDIRVFSIFDGVVR